MLVIIWIKIVNNIYLSYPNYYKYKNKYVFVKNKKYYTKYSYMHHVTKHS